ncbi:MAG: threonine synthase [Anaerolineales bacterium]
MIVCSSCQDPYPEGGVPFRCPACGGLYDFQDHPPFQPDQVERDLPGVWPYWHSFGYPVESAPITLGEGNTPLVWGDVFGIRVGFKVESQNPTGSFKDRGTALLVSFLRSRGITSAVEDSSGNAGSSFAAYAARAGLDARVYIPAYASGPKRVQIERYGAEIVAVPGPRSEAARAVKHAAEEGAVYASHAYLPHGLPGFSTIAYELWEEMGEAPGSVVMPVGHGSLLLGIARGFQALKAVGVISRMPALVGVQAQACAPLFKAYEKGKDKPVPVPEEETLAEGVRIQIPYRGKEVLNWVRESQGRFVSVPEPEIKRGRERLAGLGLYVEWTSALVWDGLAQVVGQVPEPVIAILTGHGLKNS